MTHAPALPRHAVYFAPPPQHPLWVLGCHWLGRAADDAGSAGAPAGPLVATPWRYGFHATLKAPMALADDEHAAGWLAAVGAVAARHRPFDLPALHVARLADFIALRPARAARCDPSAAAPGRRLRDRAGPLARAAPGAARPVSARQTPLDARQRANVDRFGYPHVLDDWRFHMTLSNDMAGENAERIAELQAAAARHFAPALGLPLRCEHLCVFVEPGPGQPFELRHRFALGGR